MPRGIYPRAAEPRVRIQTTVPPNLHSRLLERAAQENTTINAIIIRALMRELAEEGKGEG